MIKTRIRKLFGLQVKQPPQKCLCFESKPNQK